MNYVTGLQCLNCGTEFPNEPMFEGCPDCRSEELASNVAPVYDYTAIAADISRESFDSRPGGVWAYPELLPVAEDYAVTNGEGDTPLIEASSLGTEIGAENLYLKDESQNPTWSYKDRLCSVVLSKAKEQDADVVTISSTGNHGASTAAYAARAGLESVIFTIPEVPATMKTLMQVYGANVVATPSHDDRWTIMQKCIEEYDWYPAGNYVFPPVGSNFYGIEGYKSIAFEICQSLDWKAPDWVVQPTAYADGLTGIWRGFKDLNELGFIDNLPTMVAVEPFGPLKNALDNDLDHVDAIDSGETISFSIGAGISTQQGLVTLQEGDGEAVVVDDPSVRRLQKMLGETTGIYAEASAAISVAAVQQLSDQGRIHPDDIVVAMNTSTGLKDTEMTAESLPEVPVIQPELDELRAALEDSYQVTLSS